MIMWNPVKDYPIASFIEGFNTVVVSLFLFAAACISGYLLVVFEPGNFTFIEIICGWFFMLIVSIIAGLGIPLALILFWTFYRMLYSDDSRIKLFLIATTTQSAACTSVYFIGNHSDHFWPRILIVSGFLTAAFFLLKKFGLLRNEG